jgi:hypothetical protein
MMLLRRHQCDDVGMTTRRVVLLVTCLVVGGLTGWFSVAHWEQANRVATVLAALAAVAAVGVAVWAALPGSTTPAIRVSHTGPATSGPGGTSTSGLKGPTAWLRGSLEVDHTGEADASRGGDATTGADLT